jgi:chitin synthase
VVDPVTSLTRLFGQRRRWINGSWFAFNYVHEHSYESNSCLFYIQLLYYAFVQGITWMQITIFYVAMNLTLISAVQSFVVPAIAEFFQTDQNYQLYNYRVTIFNIRNVINSIPDIVNFIYITVLFGNLLYGVLVNHNNPRYKKLYYLSASILGIYGLIVIILLVVNSVSILLEMYRGEGKEDFIIPLIWLRIMIIFIIVGHALPVLWTFSFKKYVEMVTSVLSYIYYSPVYINLLQMFAFSRIDDLSWGTKGLDNDNGEGVER